MHNNNNKINHSLFKFIKFSFKAYKPYYFIVILSCLVLSSETVYNAYSLSLLISYLEKNDFDASIKIGMIIVSLNFIFYFLNKYMNRLKDIHSQMMEIKVDKLIMDKLTHLPFQYLEDPYYLDLKERAKMGVNSFGAVYRLITSMANLLQNLITLISLITIVATFDIYVVLILVSGIILTIITVLIVMKTQMKFFRDLVPLNRKFIVYLNQMNDEKNGKDFRNYRIGNLIAKNYAKFEQQTADEFRKLYSKVTRANCLGEFVKYAQVGGIYIIIALKTILNHLPISSFSLYVSAALSFNKTVTGAIDSVVELIQSKEYVKPVVELMLIPNEEDRGKKIPFEGVIDTLEFKNVSFSYPHSEQVIIDDVSFKINKTEKISIVGLNGAGKTTLIKLICRLYKPTKGVILINNININDYEFNSYIKQISAVFQDFKLFAYTLKENILNGEGDSEVAYSVACKVGLKNKIDSLPNGINSLYTKSYDDDGIELSGGEAQKVAIARSLYSHSSLVILDEPTSALDPLAEADIYQNFNDLVQDKTAIYISHRMSSSVFCDKILVLDGGSIKAYDSHKNLMKDTSSLYFKLFMAQANNYKS